jgi:hypothetical protein
MFSQLRVWACSVSRTVRPGGLLLRLYRTVLVLKVRDSRIVDRLRLFEMTGSGIVVDDTPDRAEAILSEAVGQAGWGGRLTRTRPPGSAPTGALSRGKDPRRR